MSKTIYVANLSETVSEEAVKTLFTPYGDIHSIKLIHDAETGKPMGYGFIEMDDEPAIQAIHALNGKELEGKSLQVNQARGRSTAR